MFDEEAPQHITERSYVQKGKRAKTFTGCWTCRSRKVKCDLQRPNCGRCEKSGLECGGYDIKLRWSNPVKFDPYGTQLSTTPVGSLNDEPQYRRRNIEYVRYKEEYQYYEDMDEELTALHKPPSDKIANGETWIIKKFGVFKGIDSPAEPSKTKWRRLATQSKPPKDEEASNLYKSNVEARPFDFLEDDAFFMNFPSTNEWISKELRDDVLVSASALQEFPISGMPLSSGSVTSATPLEEEPNQKDVEDFEAGNNMTPSHGQNDEQVLQQALQVLLHRHIPFDTPVSSTDERIGSEEDTTPTFQEQIGIKRPILGSAMPRAAMEIVDSPIPDPKIFNSPDNKNPLLNLPTTGLHVHGLTRFLLDYYIENVAHLMTIVALETNPWKTLYFPRALQAVGDLAGLGYASNSRNSILNALLAIACFNVSSKFPRRTPEAQFFLNLGIEFRKQASTFLKRCMKTTIKNEKYKDVLTAMLSMNSIDVVWGTMSECQYHLTVCEDFIEARMKERPKISEKAKTLHRLFSFLKLIQDSTALDKVKEKEITIKDRQKGQSTGKSMTQSDNRNGFLSRWQAGDEITKHIRLFTEVLDESTGKIRMKHLKVPVDNPSGSVPKFKDYTGGKYIHTNQRSSKSNALNTDDLYGLPKSLISLFSDCVCLARHNEYYKRNSISNSQEFDDVCSNFEDELIHWKSEWQFCEKGSKEFINFTIEGVYHHTMSFYYGLVIYYSTMVRDLPHQHLQPYVAKVLHHLEALDVLVETKDVKIVPLFWQGFIAGCGSVDGKTQAGFRTWAAKLSTNGIGSYWGARQVMLEVWRRRENKMAEDNWYAVYRDWEMNLMLS